MEADEAPERLLQRQLLLLKLATQTRDTRRRVLLLRWAADTREEAQRLGAGLDPDHPVTRQLDRVARICAELQELLEPPADV